MSRCSYCSTSTVQYSMLILVLVLRTTSITVALLPSTTVTSNASSNTINSTVIYLKNDDKRNIFYSDLYGRRISIYTVQYVSFKKKFYFYYRFYGFILTNSAAIASSSYQYFRSSIISDIHFTILALVYPYIQWYHSQYLIAPCVLLSESTKPPERRLSQICMA